MKTTAKSLVMKPMFRLRVELDKKKEAKYNPPNFDDIEDVEWKEWLEWKNNYKKFIKQLNSEVSDTVRIQFVKS